MNNNMMNNRGPNNQGPQGGGFPGDFPPPPAEGQLDFLSVPSKLELTVSPEMCGALIGKGGCTIKEVRGVTGVKMSVAGNEKGTKEDRTVTLVGTQAQIHQAERMLVDMVRAYRK